MNMGNEELDICERIRNDEAIQHLLSLLRQTQIHCIDSECFTADQSPGPNRNQLNSDYFFCGIALVVIIFLYFAKPIFQRHNPTQNLKNNTTYLSISKKDPEDDSSTQSPSIN